MAMVYVVQLSSGQCVDQSALGGKGANLARLVCLGCNVPPGFVVTVDAYREFIAYNELGAFLSDLLKDVAGVDPDVRDDLSQRIRRRFAEAKLPEAISLALGTALQACPADSFAVRSSAVAEDSPRHSFAGLFDTYLNVAPQNVAGRLKACWASAYTPRALAYRAARGLLQDVLLGMAVIVQEMVRPDWSGVMFTTDPVARSGAVVIEVARGLGDKLVSGQVRPNRYRADRQSLQVLASSEDQGPVPENVIRSVAQQGLRIESAFGRPQDIEFAITGDTVHVLQTRPITTL